MPADPTVKYNYTPTKPSDFFKGLFSTALDFTPVVGDAKGLLEGVQDLQKGNTGMGLLGIAGAVPLFGTAGDVAKKVAKFSFTNLDAKGMTPNLYDYAKTPVYYTKNKGFTPEIVEMNTEEYLREAAKLNSKQSGVSATEILASRRLNKENIDGIAKEMEKGTEFAAPYLNYRKGFEGQEGFHRTLAAQKLGMDTIPVMVIRDNK